jgi:hypothetical protein
MADEILFPGYRWSPDGKKCDLFATADDVPSGWLRNSPEGRAKLPAKKAPAKKAASKAK